MRDETPKCNSCGQSMKIIDAIGRNAQIGDIEDGKWVMKGMREMALYQCPECKDVKIY